MARTDQERFDQAFNYIKGCDAGLADDCRKKLGASQLVAGRNASLEGHSYWRSGSDAQHAAVRALIVLQTAYMNPIRLGSAEIALDVNVTKRYYHGKPESKLRDAIMSYVVKKNATHETLVQSALDVNEVGGDRQFLTLDRSSRALGVKVPVCFDAVRMWLFKAGFVSLRWFVTSGFDLTANTANEMLGDGTVIGEDDLEKIPRGSMFNFHRDRTKTVCHWGLSLGGGQGIAANTTSAAGDKVVHFTSGGTPYGQFPLRDSYEVCVQKYEGNVTIRSIDPTAVDTYF